STVSSGLALRYENSSFAAIWDCSCHCALIAESALPARNSFGAATPIKSPSRITLTACIWFAAEQSIAWSFAPKEGGLRTRPYSISGRLRSEVYLCRPVTKSSEFIFGRLLPAWCHWAGGVVRPFVPITLSQLTAEASSA